LTTTTRPASAPAAPPGGFFNDKPNPIAAALDARVGR
jgi:hypothetical protein